MCLGGVASGECSIILLKKNLAWKFGSNFLHPRFLCVDVLQEEIALERAQKATWIR